MERSKKTALVTIAIVAAAFVVTLIPGLPALFVYDRNAIFEGEVWRVLTGHWVHFSASHLFHNALAVGVAGCILESRHNRSFKLFCLVSPILIGAALLAIEPAMEIYGGLSGLATGAFLLLFLDGLRSPGWRSLSTFGLSLLILKTLAPGFRFVELNEIQISRTSHLAGAGCGLLAHFLTRLPFRADRLAALRRRRKSMRATKGPFEFRNTSPSLGSHSKYYANIPNTSQPFGRLSR